MFTDLQSPARRRRKPRRTLEEAEVLAQARQAQADVNAAEARKLAAAVAWAALHEVTDEDHADSWGDGSVSLAGPGAPMIAQGCVAEFGAVIGSTTGGGRAYLADALELSRFPLLYSLIQDGFLPVWKGRRIVRATTELPAAAAADLDTRIAPLAGRLSARQTQQMVDETIASAIPEVVQEIADSFSNERLDINHQQVSFVGASVITGALRLQDAVDLDARLTTDAQALQGAGHPGTVDELRARALGMLARGESLTRSVARAVTLYVHLPADTTNPTALVQNGGDGRLLSQAQVAQFCGNPDVKVTVKPVIDLHDVRSSRGYDVPDVIREHLELRDRTCVFPHCDRPAWHTQKDHIQPFDAGGPTSTENLASLCQHHHNLKTHVGWSYFVVEPGVFLWRSPHGYVFLRDRHGALDLTAHVSLPSASG